MYLCINIYIYIYCHGCFYGFWRFVSPMADFTNGPWIRRLLLVVAQLCSGVVPLQGESEGWMEWKTWPTDASTLVKILQCLYLLLPMVRYAYHLEIRFVGRYLRLTMLMLIVIFRSNMLNCQRRAILRNTFR